MKFTELKQNLLESAGGCYLLEGDDAYFRRRGEEQIKDKFLTSPELDYSSFDGETLKGAAITSLTSAAASFPFISEKRVVKVSEFYPTETEFEKYLKSFLTNFPAHTVLIIVNRGGKKGVDLKRKTGVKYVDCNRADGDTVTKWAYVTLKRAGVTADAATCAAIADYCLSDMARVSTEVEKIIFLKKGETLTRLDVDELVYKDAEYRMYEMNNAISRRDWSAFTAVVNDLLQKGGDELSILSALYSYFKNLLTSLEYSGSDVNLAALLKMKEYGAKKCREQAYSMGKQKLETLLESCYRNISAVKSGKKTAASALKCQTAEIFFA